MFEFDMDSNKYTNIHFIGIGGISMSGLAEILLVDNHRISGSDAKDSKVVKRLKKLGAEIFIGHDVKNISDDLDLVIYTDAISENNVEFVEAKNRNIPITDRATFLGALMKNYRDSIAVSGTHGKTTTTSMLSTILANTNINPTILLGGQLKEIGGNVKLGSRNCILTEACEYKGNILKYFPSIAIILNMDEDHLDYFKSMDHIIETFASYAENLNKEDYLIINNDDENKDKIIDRTSAKVITFGIDSESDYSAKNISFEKGDTKFDLYIDNKFISCITINLIGRHNVYNALASIAASHMYGVPIETIKENIFRYKGVERRLELKGFYKNIKILDDYAHHPTEIQVTLDAVKNSNEGRIYCVFQPHTFTRTQKLFDNFKLAFKDADVAIITDIYAARELDDGSVHSQDLVNAIENTEAIYLKDFKDIQNYLIENLKANDVVITMGAGNIHELGESLLEKECTAV